MWLEWTVAGLFGALIGAAEIVSQFRDEPDDALRTFPAIGYMLFNALASLLALAVIRIFGWTLGVQDPAMTGWAQVVAAGFGAMALLRASIFTVRDGERVIPIGPSRFLEVVLASVKDSVDRKRAEQRGISVSEIMKRRGFSKSVGSPARLLFRAAAKPAPGRTGQIRQENGAAGKRPDERPGEIAPAGVEPDEPGGRKSAGNGCPKSG